MHSLLSVIFKSLKNFGSVSIRQIRFNYFCFVQTSIVARAHNHTQKYSYAPRAACYINVNAKIFK